MNNVLLASKQNKNSADIEDLKVKYTYVSEYITNLISKYDNLHIILSNINNSNNNNSNELNITNSNDSNDFNDKLNEFNNKLNELNNKLNELNNKYNNLDEKYNELLNNNKSEEEN